MTDEQDPAPATTSHPDGTGGRHHDEPALVCTPGGTGSMATADDLRLVDAALRGIAAAGPHPLLAGWARYAAEVTPDARVDNAPVVLAHARVLLTGTPLTNALTLHPRWLPADRTSAPPPTTNPQNAQCSQ